MALFRQGEHSTAELAERFGVARSTVYRAREATVPTVYRPLTRLRRSARA